MRCKYSGLSECVGLTSLERQPGEKFDTAEDSEERHVEFGYFV